MDSSSLDVVIKGLSELSNVEQIYEVTGEFDIVSLVSAADIEEFGDLLKNKILKIPGVKNTVSSIVFNVDKGPQEN